MIRSVVKIKNIVGSIRLALGISQEEIIMPIIQPKYLFTDLKPRAPISAIKMAGNGEIILNKVGFSGFTKAVDICDSNTVKAKKVDMDDCHIGFYVRETNRKKEKNMGLDLKRVKFKKMDAGVVAPDTYDIKARDVEFEDVKEGFKIYLSSLEKQKMGLPDNTPDELIAEAIQIIKSHKEKEAVENLSQSRLFTWLGVASNSVTIATPIVKALFSLAASI